MSTGSIISHKGNINLYPSYTERPGATCVRIEIQRAQLWLQKLAVDFQEPLAAGSYHVSVDSLLSLSPCFCKPHFSFRTVGFPESG